MNKVKDEINIDETKLATPDVEVATRLNSLLWIKLSY